MSAALRRLGRWLCRYDLEPVRQHFRWQAESGWFSRDEVAEARSMLRVLNGHDPADVSKGP